MDTKALPGNRKRHIPGSTCLAADPAEVKHQRKNDCEVVWRQDTESPLLQECRHSATQGSIPAHDWKHQAETRENNKNGNNMAKSG